MLRNATRAALLLGALSGLLLWVGSALAGTAGVVVALVLAVATNAGLCWWSDRLALRLAGACPASPLDYPRCTALLEQLAAEAGLPAPRLYVSPSPQPNAFATGRSPSNAAVCVNAGLLELLDADELEGVLAHELSHVVNRDVLIGTIAATLAAAVTAVARLGLLFGGDEEHPNPVTALLLLLVAPVAAVLLQLAVSRSRETAADAAGALLCRKPLALASALAKIEAGARTRRFAGRTRAEASPAFGSLYIAAPLGGTGGLEQLLVTHPSTRERIRRLEALAARRPRIGRGKGQRIVEVVGLGSEGAAAGAARAGIG